MALTYVQAAVCGARSFPQGTLRVDTLTGLLSPLRWKHQLRVLVPASRCDAGIPPSRLRERIKTKPTCFTSLPLEERGFRGALSPTSPADEALTAQQPRRSAQRRVGVCESFLQWRAPSLCLKLWQTTRTLFHLERFKCTAPWHFKHIHAVVRPPPSVPITLHLAKLKLGPGATPTPLPPPPLLSMNLTTLSPSYESWDSMRRAVTGSSH